ncbi:MAG TPA: TIGR01777 family oxidoreductase [Chthoniobacterales bacterium]|nr:TIGR01777 family oxidoreductase [Chthoniobacterales bacterium]
MKIGITGASGFIGSHVARLARTRGHEAVAFSREPRTIPGFAETRKFSTDATPDLSGLDAIVHLAGETIMGLWTPPKKRRILASRVEGTRRIVEALNASSTPPGVFICSSAIGYYGDTGEREVTEASPVGEGFLAGVTEAWEREAEKASRARTVCLRIGFVLGPDGGAMKLIAPVFRSALGGRLGSGRQWMSCIHVEDVAGLILHAIEQSNVRGPLNAVLPDPVRNSDFTRALARAAHRPAIFPAPAFALKVALGELSHLLLDSQRVIPEATVATGYAYRFPTLEAVAADVFTG